MADYAHYQRDHVTTRLVPAHTELAGRLATDGWRIHQNGDRTLLQMVRKRSRLWFFSADGTTTGVEFHGRVVDAQKAGPKTIAYKLNGQLQTSVRWSQSENLVVLPFKSKAARVGWNTLDINVRGKGPEPGDALFELTGFRVMDRWEGLLADERPRAITVDGGDLLTPADSLFEMALRVPDGGLLTARVDHEPFGSTGISINVRLKLVDEVGTVHELAGFRVDPGDTDRLRIDLSPWAGQTVHLRFAVDGPRGPSVRWRQAGIRGGQERQPAAAPIRPARVVGSGRLGRPDVVIIVLDAARADAFGSYGARYPTPVVDSLAAAGTRFETALSPSSWTGQSIPALLTGFHPDTLGIERWADPLPEEVPSIAELMARAGYRTVLWSQHPIYNRTESLVRGFQHVRYSGRRNRSLLPGRHFLFERERPTFALIHLLPPHSPYKPPAPFRGAFTSDYRGDVPPKLGALSRAGRSRLLGMTAEDHEYIRGRYQENVAFADWLVGRVVEVLRNSRRLGDALVVVSSDHGEAFFEHGRFMHSRELYQEFLRIPLVIKWPSAVTGYSPKVEDAATLIDLVPTLVDGLGLEAERGFQGESLLPAALDGAPLERPLYATTRGLGDVDRLAKPRFMLQAGDWRVIHDPVAGSTELYSVAADPGEQEDLAPEHPTTVRLLLQRLLTQRWFNLDLLQLGPRAEVELDPELVEELKALGYL